MKKKNARKRAFEINAILPDGSRIWSFGEATPGRIAKHRRELTKDNPGLISIARMVDRKRKA